MKKLITSSFTCLMLAGCATPMTPEVADIIGYHAGLNQKCYNQNVINGQTYQQGSSAARYLASTYSSPKQDLLNAAYNRGMRANANRSSCSAIYQMINRASEHQAEVASRKQAAEEFNKSMSDLNKSIQANRPVTCNSVPIGGGMVSTSCY